MQSKDRQKLLFVINPVSGKKTPDWKALISDFFKDLSHNIDLFEMTGKNDSAILKQKIADFQPGKVIAVGGDGTVKMVAETMLHSNIPMGIIPAGSANGMAMELDIPTDPPKALDIILQGNTRKIDLIDVNNELCLHLCDIGLNALLVKYFHKSKRRGMWGYGRSVIKTLWNRKLLHLEITTVSQKIRRNAFMVVLANASKYGTGATINPEGIVDDGYFEVVILRRLNLVEILKALFTHRTFDPEKIEVIKTQEATVFSRRRAHFQIDGEYRGKVKIVNAKIVHGLLEILIPKQELTAA